MTPLYRVAADVYVRLLDEEMAVYLAHRFETHLLDEIGAQVLETVQFMQDSAQPCSIATLYRQLGIDPEHTYASPTRLSASGAAGPIPGDSNSQYDTDTNTEAELVLMPLLSELVRLGVLTTQAC